MNELHYTYRVEWSPEDEEWVGLVAEFPSLSWLDGDPLEAMRGIRDLVAGVVEDMRESGEIPPAPFADRRYSGKVFVRTSPELHRRLTIEAAEQGVSVNQWAMQKLAERSGGGVQRHQYSQDANSGGATVLAQTNLGEKLPGFVELVALLAGDDQCAGGSGGGVLNSFVQYLGDRGVYADQAVSTAYSLTSRFKNACLKCGVELDPTHSENADAVADSS